MLYPVAAIRSDRPGHVVLLVPSVRQPDGEPVCAEGADLETAMGELQMALEAVLMDYLDAGLPPPPPPALETLLGQPAAAGAVWLTIDVPVDRLDTKVERVLISVPRRALLAIDRAAQARGQSRSGLLVEGALLLAGAATQLKGAEPEPESRSQPKAQDPATIGPPKAPRKRRAKGLGSADTSEAVIASPAPVSQAEDDAADEHEPPEAPTVPPPVSFDHSPTSAAVQDPPSGAGDNADDRGYWMHELAKALR